MKDVKTELKYRKTTIATKSQRNLQNPIFDSNRLLPKSLQNHQDLQAPPLVVVVEKTRGRGKGAALRAAPFRSNSTCIGRRVPAPPIGQSTADQMIKRSGRGGKRTGAARSAAPFLSSSSLLYDDDGGGGGAEGGGAKRRPFPSSSSRRRREK